MRKARATDVTKHGAKLSSIASYYMNRPSAIIQVRSTSWQLSDLGKRQESLGTKQARSNKGPSYKVSKCLLLYYQHLAISSFILSASKKQSFTWTPLVVQWLRIHLPTHGIQIQPPVQEDLTCCGATKPMHRDYRSLHAQSLCAPRREATAARSRSAATTRSHRSEKPERHNWRKPQGSNTGPAK